MPAQNSNSNDYYPGEQVLFTIRGNAKKRVITAAVFVLFVVVTILGLFVLKRVFTTVLGFGALLLSFWPLADAYERIEVTNMRIKRSGFSKKTAKTTDVPLDRLAACRETKDGTGIELLFLADDSKTLQSVMCLRFRKAEENALRLLELPCPKQEDLEQILDAYYK